MVLLVVLLTLGSSAITALGGEPGDQGLFAASVVGGSIDRAGDPTIIRSRYVDLNLGLLFDEDGAPRELLGNPLILNFFEDTALVAVLDRVEPGYGGGFTWTGQVQDEPLSLVTLAVNEGVMAGTVLMPGAVFEISYAANGVHAVAEIDQSAFPPDADPIVPDLPENETLDAVPTGVTDDGSIIDVMVVYTQLARSAAGGTTQMLNLINDAINQTNSTYANSQIAQRLRLVYAAEVSYTESGIDVDLTRLRNNGDGYMDIVHTWRNTYGADEVALIVEYPYSYPYCGIAYLMATLTTSFESYAFATIERECVTGNLSFAHELGHNMGAHHDWYTVQKYNQGTGLFWYSYGYVNTTKRWRTIMAYNDACGDLGFYCDRILYWSNPDVYVDSVPVGAASANNHLTLNDSAWTVANFRQSVVGNPPDAPTSLSATPVSLWQINLSWTDNSNDENGFRIERSLNNVNWSTLGTVGANTTIYPDTSATPGTLYYYRVIAFNTYGDSDPSNTASAELDAEAGPLVYNGYVIDDDIWFGTSGDDDGYLECGETVDLTVLLANAGNTAVTGIDTRLTITPRVLGDVPWSGNVDSLYPDIAGGASAGNLSAFEFSVKVDALHGHWVDFDLGIDADNWTGGPVEFSIPILCAETADYGLHLPVIFK